MQKKTEAAAEEERKKKEKRYEIALDTRKFEIELFWKRSLFFWGFVSLAFAGYFNTKSGDHQLLISSFGLILSLGWSLANRGGKYWQENWEMVIEELDEKMSDKVFRTRRTIENDNCFWLKARKFSVSKITIAISDYSTIIWLFLFIKNTDLIPIPTNNIATCIFIFTIAFMVVMFCATLSTDTEEENTEKTESNP